MEEALDLSFDRLLMMMMMMKGQIEVTRRRGRRRKKLLDELKDRRGYCQLKGGSSRSHYVEESFWKRFWTCRLTDY